MVKITPIKENYKEKYLRFLDEQKNNLPYDMFDPDLLPIGAEILICLDESENILGICRTSYTGIIAEESLDHVFVLPDYRRDENGTLLVVAVMQRAVNRLITRLICNIESTDEMAAAFLKKLNFGKTEEKDGKTYYRKNLLYMYKTEA